MRSKPLAVLMLAALWSCGPQEPWNPREDGDPSSATQSLAGSNGLTLNGLVVNGLVVNGLVVNGLVVNGLDAQGLSSPSFADWFSQDPALSDRVMKYVVYCAENWGVQKSYTHPATGITYTWNGWLGLAHNWASGDPATVVDQQLISACLAAHVNTYGMHVQLSLLGDKATNRPLYIAKGELEEYTTREACFFGNLFTGEGLYAGNDRNTLPPEKSTPRRCGLSQTLSGVDPECAPIIRVGSCEQLSCTLDRDANYYRTCTYQGITYKVLTSRLRPSDVYTCGDGVCQVSECCGTGGTADNCGLDCGPCS
ncbi:hypothetical protein [Hyalangium rubrum]|uniref:Lipoprotein n=1 Tax=Hyalangium rubrum TaxID=3103134 RepID=A0ABU5HA37_9BACT|nr:hypothetical protein [Hyalangium sp. s54d21]MDY7230344.1 hypothetical protein [Hyalangium sp. s54d21]